MRHDAGPRTHVDRLVADLTDGTDGHALADELRDWLTGSTRFRAFVGDHRAKVRKKLRTAGDAEALRDLRAELRAAHLLLQDERIDLAFEAFGATRGGPDFLVSFRGERPVTCEITRLRRAPADVRDGGPLLGKLRQLPPSVPNLLVIAIDGSDASALDIEGAVAQIRQRADAKDEPFFVRRGFEGSRAFYARFLRLGGVITWCEGAAGDARARLWTNPSARIAVPQRAARACLAALRAAAPA